MKHFQICLWQTIGFGLLLLISSCDSSPSEPEDILEFEIIPSMVSMCEAEAVKLRAVFPDSANYDIIWTIISGQGTISADGLYAAPPEITGDSLSVTIEAAIGTNTGSRDTTEIVIRSNSTITFEKAFNLFDGLRETGHSVVQTQNNDFVVTGEVESVSGNDFYVFRIDARGEQIWSKNYGSGVGNSIIQTGDGFVAGGQADTSAMVLKIDPNGQTVWSAVLERAGFAKSIMRTRDGAFVFTGESFSPADASGGRQSHIWIVKIDANGQLLWSRTYGEGGGSSIIETSDQSLLLVGYTLLPFQTYLLKTNNDGDLLWAKSFDIGEQGVDLVETEENEFVLFGRGFQGFYLLKTNDNGDPIWSRIFDGGDNWFASSLEDTEDGGFIMSGWWIPASDEGFNVYLAKADAEGQLNWSRSFGAEGEDRGLSVRQTDDGGYVVAGQFDRANYLVKTDRNGMVRCLKDIQDEE